MIMIKITDIFERNFPKTWLPTKGKPNIEFMPSSHQVVPLLILSHHQRMIPHPKDNFNPNSMYQEGYNLPIHIQPSWYTSGWTTTSYYLSLCTNKAHWFFLLQSLGGAVFTSINTDWSINLYPSSTLLKIP